MYNSDMSNTALLPVLILTAGATLLRAQGIIEYGASAARSGVGAGAAGAAKSTTKIFDKLSTSLAGAAKSGDDVKNIPSSSSAPANVIAATTAPPPAPPALPADFMALVIGMDRADLLKKVGKPSMSMSSVESSKAVETCWYKNGAESVTVVLRDGKVAEISGAGKLPAK
jgi:hypothetical protein